MSIFVIYGLFHFFGDLPQFHYLHFKPNVLNTKCISTNELTLYQVHNISAGMQLNTFLSHNSQGTTAVMKSSLWPYFTSYFNHSTIFRDHLSNTNHIRSLLSFFITFIWGGIHLLWYTCEGQGQPSTVALLPPCGACLGSYSGQQTYY